MHSHYSYTRHCIYTVGESIYKKNSGRQINLSKNIFRSYNTENRVEEKIEVESFVSWSTITTFLTSLITCMALNLI